MLPFDRPWSYDGARDLVLWMHNYVTSAGNADYPQDLAEGRENNSASGTWTGTGCVPSNRPYWFELTGGTNTSRPDSRVVLWWAGRNGVPYAPTGLFLGTQNPARFLPWLCTPQFVDDVKLVLPYLGDGNGDFRTGNLSLTFERALAYVVLHTQAFQADSGRHPSQIPVTASQGVAIEIQPPPTGPFQISRVWNQGDVYAQTGQLEDGRCVVIESR